MKTHLIVLLLLISCTLIYPQTKNLKPEMIKVEGGTFTMGSNDGERDEKPVHQVTVGSLDIGKTEVTRELWESVMDNTSSNYIGDIKPVASVNWLSVVEFCNKLSEQEGLKKAYSISGSSVTCDFNANGYRLPTEAEWEYAASGGKQSKGYKYSGGNEIGSVAWYFDNSGGDPQNVATKLPNELGLYDMSGNVWEWCWDWYGDYTSSSQTNPEGASGGADRVFRGGSYDDYAKSCRVAKRLSGNPIRDSRTVGLRVVRTIDSPQPQTQEGPKPELIEVEGGTFTMGSNDGENNEKPSHQVTVSSFSIGKTEVTQGLWKSVMNNNPSQFVGDNRPVEIVGWNDVIEFCNKLSEREGLQKAYLISGSSVTCDFNTNGYRLPTEAEWEYAARGGNKSSGLNHSGSNEIDKVAWFWDNSGSTTHDVATKQPNELGIYDMSGNVWEWCWDWYGDYTSSSQTDPRGPNTGSLRVFRGGTWSGSAWFCRVAFRFFPDPGHRGSDLGFRVVRTKK